MQHETERPPGVMTRGDVGWMFIAAVVFGYCGFRLGWPHLYTRPTGGQGPQLVVMVALLMWTFRVGAVAFALSGVLAMMRWPGAAFVYSGTCLLAALSMTAVGIWDLLEPRYYASFLDPILLLLVAAVLGMGSWRGVVMGLAELRQWRAARAHSPALSDAPATPDERPPNERPFTES